MVQMAHQISQEDIANLASLSALSLSDSDAQSLQTDLANIIGYIEKLGELDTSGVEPTYQVTGLENVFRDDIVAESGVYTNELLDGAPESAHNQFKVPKVL